SDIGRSLRRGDAATLISPRALKMRLHALASFRLDLCLHRRLAAGHHFHRIRRWSERDVDARLRLTPLGLSDRIVNACPVDERGTGSERIRVVTLGWIAARKRSDLGRGHRTAD